MKKVIVFLTILMFGLSSTSNAQTIDKFYDKYEGRHIYSFDSKNVYLNKTISKSDTSENWDTYYIRFDTFDSYTTFSAKGAIILFEDGSKIELNGDVNLKYYKLGIHRYAFGYFSGDLIRKMAETKIIGFKLGRIFEQSISLPQREIIRKAAKKLLDTKF